MRKNSLTLLLELNNLTCGGAVGHLPFAVTVLIHTLHDHHTTSSTCSTDPITKRTHSQIFTSILSHSKLAARNSTPSPQRSSWQLEWWKYCHFCFESFTTHNTAAQQLQPQWDDKPPTTTCPLSGRWSPHLWAAMQQSSRPTSRRTEWSQMKFIDSIESNGRDTSSIWEMNQLIQLDVMCSKVRSAQLNQLAIDTMGKFDNMFNFQASQQIH